MNEKSARLARQINRAAGTLAKRDVDDKLVRHKLTRKVKRWFAGLNHKARGRARRYWGATIAQKRVVEDYAGIRAARVSRQAAMAANFSMLGPETPGGES